MSEVTELEWDSAFVRRLREEISAELQALGKTGAVPGPGRLAVYAGALSKVLERTSDYREVLMATMSEYEALFEVLRAGHQEAHSLQSTVRARAGQPVALAYYRRRSAELQERIALIEENNAKLEAQLHHRKSPTTSVLDQPIPDAADTHAMPPLKPIHGLSLHEATDPEFLTERLHQLRAREAELCVANRERFVPVQLLRDLRQQLQQEMSTRSQLLAENISSRRRYRRLKASCGAARMWRLHNRCGGSLLEVMVQGVWENEHHQDDLEQAEMEMVGGSGDDEPGKGSEGAQVISYIDRFNELLQDGHYEQAAQHAASSPHGILRKEHTAHCFSTLHRQHGEPLPLLLWFQTLIGSATATRCLPDARTSLEATCCSLQEHRLDLLMHWVTHCRLTFSEALGDVICRYGETEPTTAPLCLVLAHAVFAGSGAHGKAAEALCCQGRVQGALAYVYTCDSFSMEDCIYLVLRCASVELVRGLTQGWRGRLPMLSLGLVASVLVSAQRTCYAMQLLRAIYSCGPDCLREAIEHDAVCPSPGWRGLAEECERHSCSDLATAIIAAVAPMPLRRLDHDEGWAETAGDAQLPKGRDNSEGRSLMEHVFY
ncbi:clathrin heavy chain linker domain-containing protein 1-like isoform X1 [Petromyzon marinus]|uniref:clathrin heavy chain linker domain-containing protein 1-like isoform X1 n=1 Tax=Petromyzon marinus TaxID=7757 RepID=UPI003F723E8B